jgi:hypothetical protein
MFVPKILKEIDEGIFTFLTGLMFRGPNTVGGAKECAKFIIQVCTNHILICVHCALVSLSLSLLKHV